MAIDIGAGAIDRNTQVFGGTTRIDLTNSANDTGRITSIELWFNENAEGVKVGTFHGSSTDYTSRDVENIGNVTSGSKQTFSGLNCDVTTGDFLGVYANPLGTGIEYSNDGPGSGIYSLAGDQFGTGLQTYTLFTPRAQSAYGTGITVVNIEITVPLAGTVNGATLVPALVLDMKPVIPLADTVNGATLVPTFVLDVKPTIPLADTIDGATLVPTFIRDMKMAVPLAGTIRVNGMLMTVIIIENQIDNSGLSVGGGKQMESRKRDENIMSGASYVEPREKFVKD